MVWVEKILKTTLNYCVFITVSTNSTLLPGYQRPMVQVHMLRMMQTTRLTTASRCARYRSENPNKKEPSSGFLETAMPSFFSILMFKCSENKHNFILLLLFCVSECPYSITFSYRDLTKLIRI